MNEKKGSGAKFAKLKAKLAKKDGVKDPAALAAYIGRKKYGKKEFQKMAANGRKKEDIDALITKVIESDKPKDTIDEIFQVMKGTKKKKRK